LETVILPVNLTGFGNTSYDYGYQGAFQGCTVLDSINLADTKLTNIGERAFSGCTSLTSVTLPGTVTVIDRGAFSGCMITSIDLPDNLTTIGGGSDYAGGGAFQNCAALTSIDLSNTKVTQIGDQAFSGCSLLASIELPDTLTSITRLDEWDGGTFQNCVALTSIDLSDTKVTQIGNWAFSGCTLLASIELPDTLTSIGGGAFENCTSLVSIDLPDTLTYIAASRTYYPGAFDGCTNITFSGSGNDYFSIIENGKVLIVDNVLYYWYAAKTGAIVIPEGITDIGRHFSGSEITSITLPSTLTSIAGYDYYDGNGAFQNCTSLTSVDLSGCTSLTSIGSYAFSGCTSLASINLPDSLTSIGGGAFDGCTNITFSGSGNDYFSIIENGKVLIVDNVLHYWYAAKTGAIVIPEGITAIGNWFQGSGISSIKLPRSLLRLLCTGLFLCEDFQAFS
jgi:hypothetical protein